LHFDEKISYNEWVKAMESEEHRWKSLFLPKDFDVDESLAEYRK
jgi:hypothetical protein